MNPVGTDLNRNRRLGDFELLSELGRGGMGIVYEARQISLSRRVALKVLSGTIGLAPQAVKRFKREAEAAARLHHTNIVPVYAIGEQDGVHFYAMELIEGPSLDRTLSEARQSQSGSGNLRTADTPSEFAATAAYDSNRLDSSESASNWTSSAFASDARYFDYVARLISEVAEALDYAHNQGVVHRDIKPSNLLVSPNGKLSLNDFGLARVLEAPNMTATGEMLGTPAYMSPEQITAGRTPLDHRTDIYSLGATLYEMLTLRAPFFGERREQLFAQILHKDPVSPRRINKKIPLDLETICLKAMDKDPDKRYQTAKDLAKDLGRYVDRFAISARRAGPVSRLTKLAKRNPSVAALCGCLLVALILVSYFSYQTYLAQNQLQTEQRQAAMDTAVIEAMSGDSRAALQAIADAETKGADSGRLNMLRGLIEKNSGRPREAIVYLEQAQKLLTESLAVKSLLAEAFADNGQWQQYDEMFVTLEQIQPKTDEDRIFLGLVQVKRDPFLAIQTLDGVSRRSRQSPVARLAKANALVYQAWQTGQADDAVKALDELAKIEVADNPLLLHMRMKAQLAIALAAGANDPRRDAALEFAARDFDTLCKFQNNPIAFFARCNYHAILDHDDALLDEVRQAHKLGIQHPWSSQKAIVILYSRNRLDEALRLAEESTELNTDNIWTFVYKGNVLAAMPHRQLEAYECYSEAIRMCQRGTALAYISATLQLLGPDYAKEVRQSSLDVRNRSAHLLPNARDRWYHELLAFHAGISNEAELLKKAGDSRFNQCEANYYIGLRKLAEKNRADAKTYFQRSVDTGVFFYAECLWSRAFLARIDDPDWLPWLPME